MELNPAGAWGIGFCQEASMSGSLLAKILASSTTREPISKPANPTITRKMTYASASAGVRVRLAGNKRSRKLTSGASK